MADLTREQIESIRPQEHETGVIGIHFEKLNRLCDMAEKWRASQQAAPSAIAATDMVLVPREPTEAMLDAAWNENGSAHDSREVYRQAAASDYCAMLAAAPQAQQECQAVDTQGCSGEAMRWCSLCVGYPVEDHCFRGLDRNKDAQT